MPRSRPTTPTHKPRVLVVTRKDDVTADFVILGLQEQDIPYLRFNTDEFPARVSLTWSPTEPGDRALLPDGEEYNLSCLDSVWYRRTGAPAIGHVETPYQEFAEREAREALQWIWEALDDTTWVSHPAKIERAESKLRQLQYANEEGARTPETLLTNDPNSLEEFQSRVKGPLVAKALRKKLVEVEGETKAIFTTPLQDLPNGEGTGLKAGPVMFQEEVPKEADIRVTVIGDQVFATRIESQGVEIAETDWRRASAEDLEHSVHDLPSDIEDFCIGMVQDFDLKFGAFDFVLTPKEEYVFLEMNPNGQWAWIEPLTGQPMKHAMIDLLLDMGG